KVVNASDATVFAAAPAESAVSLDGTDSYVELPPNIFDNLDEATIGGWVKWDRLGRRPERFFNYGTGADDLSITTLWRDARALTFVIVDAAHQLHELYVTNFLR